jgi:hypothetical protein
MNPSVVAQIARLGAAELEKRAEQPQKWRPPEKPLTDDEMDLVIANVNAWPGVVRRPEDGYAPPPSWEQPCRRRPRTLSRLAILLDLYSG